MIRVLGRANSINVQKVMWLTGELGLDVERVDIGGAFGGNDQPEYLAKNPDGRVPTLEDGDFVLWESHSIVRYLAEKYGSSPWWPAKLEDRALASKWMDYCLFNMHPPMTTIFWTLIRTPEAERDMDAVAKCVASASKFWKVVDGQLAKTNFLTGTAPCIGDIPLGCMVYRWYALDIDRPDLPNLRAWHDRLAERKAFQEHVMLPLT